MIRSMDMVIRHVDGHPRRFRGPPSLVQVGYFPEKDYRIRRPFATWNYSFILSGTGTYRHQGEFQVVEAPAILTQSPGAPMDYGPVQGSWEELYLIYPSEAGSQLAAAGLWTGRPWWSLRDSRRFRRAIEDLRELLLGPNPTADRLDHAAELAVMEGILGAEASVGGGLEGVVQSILSEVENHWREDLDFRELARHHGMSYPHFRRCWQQQVGMPPVKYLTELRLRHAARALVVGDQPIHCIAQDIGFKDPLHFSRRFHAVMGHSPTAYRERYRVGDIRLPTIAPA